MAEPGSSAFRILRYPSMTIDSDRLAREEPLEIRVDGEPLAVTMRTPGNDSELAAGFCLTEGVIDSPDDLERVVPCSEAKFGNIVDVILAPEAHRNRQVAVCEARRDFYLSSSCGLCGTQTLERIHRRIPPIQPWSTIDHTVLARLSKEMSKAQLTFAETGGLHAAAVFTPQGELMVLQEDVGRHNAVDKVIGALLLSGQLPAAERMLLVSGRASFELVQKAARAGIPFLAAIGAPSSLAVEAARRFRITLVGFLRPDRWNQYTGVACDDGS